MPSGVLRAERPEQGVRRVAVVRVAVRTSWEFRHLVSFITIAEELHFGRAVQR
jgi:hypothetical protein